MDPIVNLAAKYEDLGIRRLKNGTVLYGKSPEAGPEAYLHNVFPGCSEAEIATIEKQVGMELPDSLKSLLQLHNGFDLFFGTLSFFGIRPKTGRSYDVVMGQPYCIVSANTRERPEHIPEGDWVAGSYNWDLSRVCVSPKGKVSLYAPKTAELINSWPSLEKYLVSECNRLPKFFDENGIELDEEANTLPV